MSVASTVHELMTWGYSHLDAEEISVDTSNFVITKHLTKIDKDYALITDLSDAVLYLEYSSAVCDPIGYYISFWNIPFFPEGCTEPMMADKSTYTSLVRTLASDNKMGGAFVEIFK